MVRTLVKTVSALDRWMDGCDALRTDLAPDKCVSVKVGPTRTLRPPFFHTRDFRSNRDCSAFTVRLGKKQIHY